MPLGKFALGKKCPGKFLSGKFVDRKKIISGKYCHLQTTTPPIMFILSQGCYICVLFYLTDDVISVILFEGCIFYVILSDG